MGHLLSGLGAKVSRVVVNDIQEATYFARLIVEAENELTSERKVIEIDARPSDCLALAIQQKAPVYVAQHVWDAVEDMSEVLRKMETGEFGTDESEEE